MKAYREPIAPIRRKPSKGGWFSSFFIKAVLVFLIVTITPTIALRWFPPPLSSFMLQSLIGAWWTDDLAFRLHYRWVPWGDISPAIKIAVVAAEDQRFPHHRGFDIDSIRSAVEDYRNGGNLRGASTISQQVAKNLFLWPGRSFIRKLLEAYFTTIIELTWPKRRILEAYLNIVEFGPGVYGVSAAANLFFEKPAAELVIWEAVSLASVLPNPSSYSVQIPSDYVLGRRVWIVNQIHQLGGDSYLNGINGDRVADKQITRR